MGKCTRMDFEEIESAELKKMTLKCGKYHFKLNKVTMIDILRKTKMFKFFNTRHSLKKKLLKHANMNAN